MSTGEDPETAEQGTAEFNRWQILGTVGAAVFQLQEFQTLAQGLMYNLTTLSSLVTVAIGFPGQCVCLIPLSVVAVYRAAVSKQRKLQFS